LTRSKTLLVALALALPIPVAVAGCGGDDGGDEDPQDIVEAAFNNDTKIESGVVDISLDFAVEGDQGGNLEVALSGPFANDPEDPANLGQLDWDFSVTGDGAIGESLPDGLEGGITITEDNLFVNYNDTDYELGEEAFTQLKEQQAATLEESGVDESSTFKEQCAQAIEAQGGDAAACEIDVTAWFSELENEGTEDKGGTESNHVSGTLDVEQMVTDLFNLGASVPGATGGVDPSLIEPQLGMISEAVSGADFDVYASTEDDTLRGLDFSLDLDTASLGGGAAGVDAGSLGFSLEISDVGEEQSFEAPSDPQPIEDLAQEFGLPGGIPGAALPGGAEVPEIPGGGSDPAELQDCIEKASGDPAEIDKCLQ
jgi:hypothetical protein